MERGGRLLEFEMLGALRVLAGGEALALGGPRQRAVLALLLVEAPAAVSGDRLIDELWAGQPPATAAHAVQVHVSALRKLLRTAGEEMAVRSTPSGYALDVGPERVDARRFEPLVEAGERVIREDSGRGRTLLEEALGLWRGAPLADLDRFDFARRESERLTELHTRAVEALAEARLASGEHGEAISMLIALASADPLRERPRRLLMLALYRGGRHAEALAVYRDACAALDEVGLLPGPELKALEQAVLRHDESLRTPADDPPPVRRRKIVTVLCCEVAASTPRGEELDPEALLETTRGWSAELRAIVGRHGGTVAESLGDTVTAVFGIPRTREDDALRALRAASEFLDRLPVVAEAADVVLGFRAAVVTGLVLAGAAEEVPVGSAVSVAARLRQSAGPGEVLLDHETLTLARDAVAVEPVGAVPVTGKSQAVPAFRLSRVDPLAPAIGRHLDLPLIGRERELNLLCDAFDRAVHRRSCQLFTLLGPAGVGKTRLVSELLARLADTTSVLSGRCLPYGEGITFWPLIEALTPIGEPARQALERIGAGGVAAPAELFWEVRRPLEALAGERPLVLHVDDLQWAEPMLLDLLDHVAEFSRAAPILLLCTSRPELLEDQPGWGSGKPDATTFAMEALDAAACELLLAQLTDDLPQENRRKMIALSGGNPLFLKEMAAVAREPGAAPLPSTIQALLGARLERLGHKERDLLECAAVEGEVFHIDAVAELWGERADADVDAALAGLVRKDLIRPYSSQMSDRQTFAFRHLLIRDAAYRAATKETRAGLHERFAGWLEHDVPELPELDEIAGWHLEQAVTYRGDIGSDADPTLTRRAAEHLHMAGRRAARRGDTVAARKLLDRAHRLASEDGALAAAVGVDLAEQLIEGGDLARVDSLLSAAERNADTAGHGGLVRLHWLALTQPGEAPRTIEARLPDMLRQLAAAGDESGLAKAYLAGFWAKSQQAVRTEAAAEQAHNAADHARKAGDRGLRSRALALYIAAILHGPRDAAALIEELDAIEAEDVGPYVMALVTIARGEVERLEGRLDRGRPLMQKAVEQFRAMRIHTMMASCQNWLAWSELAGGDPGGALAGLCEADRELATIGERSFRATIQATTAQVRQRLGEPDRARAAIQLAEELVAPEDHLTLVVISVARARLARVDDEPETAERWARRAIEHAYRTNVTFLQGIAQLELGRATSALGREQEAQSAAREALELFDAKGDRPRASEAQAFVDQLEAIGSVES
ncbi:MAG TPA: BTAD domain-containing putative transcriptional regulator [Solirubrobacterales bacterium]|nr:BTAD domain-containing putative transcriptional regulator [Solirubrobacterales bacterium]